MARIRGSVALTLTFVNIIGSISILSLTIMISQNKYRNRNRLLMELSQIDNPHPNLRGTKLKLIKIKSEVISKRSKNYEPSIYTEDEFILPEKQISEKFSPQNLRQLSLKKDNFLAFAILADLMAIFLIFILMFSFCVDKNECCDRDSQGELGLGCCICCMSDECHCNCKGGNGDSGQGLLLCLLIVLIFVLLYFAVKACGKHISRYVAITGELLLNLSISILVFIYGFEDNLTLVVCIIAGILALSNFLGLLLPNLSCCIFLTYGYRANVSIINDPLVQNPNNIQSQSPAPPSQYYPNNFSPQPQPEYIYPPQ